MENEKEKLNQEGLKKSPVSIKNPTLEALIQFTSEKEGTADSPYNQSLTALENLQKGSNTHTDFMSKLVKDIIFTALYTTIYEEMFSTLRVHKDVGLALIQKFSEDTVDRDKLVNTHTNNHMNFLNAYGTCDGCSSCEGHADVAPLLEYIQKNDVNFFIKLYLEVQTIYVSMEQVLYELIPTRPSLMDGLSSEVIDNYRHVTAETVKAKLHNI